MSLNSRYNKKHLTKKDAEIRLDVPKILLKNHLECVKNDF